MKVPTFKNTDNYSKQTKHINKSYAFIKITKPNEKKITECKS